jgi:hypothetical protein
MNRLSGKIILISGGARGQGAAEARLFLLPKVLRSSSAMFWKRKVARSPPKN